MYRSVEPSCAPALWSRNFILICLTNFFAFVHFQLFLPTLPLFVHTLGGQEGMAGWMIGAFTLAAVAVRPWIGQWIDCQGSGKVLLWGLFLFFICTLGYVWIESVIPLLLLRIAHGVTWGVITTATGTAASQLVPPSRRGEGMGVYGLFSNLPLMFGPALGLWVVQTYSFSVLFYLSIGLAFASFAIAKQVSFLPESRRSMAETSESKLPVIKKICFPCALALTVALTLGALVTSLPLFTIDRGIPQTGWFFTIFAVTMMIARTWSGKQFDRSGPQRVLPVGIAIIICSLVILSFTRDMSLLFTAAALYGLGFGSVQPALQAWTIQRAPAGTNGKANSSFFTSIDLGIGLGSILSSILVQQAGYAAMFLAFIIPVSVAYSVYYYSKKKKSSTAGQATPPK